MSVSPNQLKDFAKLIHGHPAYEEVLLRMQKKLFIEWISADDDRRKVIGDIVVNMQFFTQEISSIFESIEAEMPVNEDTDNA